MFDVTRRITALESAVRYIPGADDNHSQSVLLEMLDELRAEKMDPSGGNRGEVQVANNNIYIPIIHGESEEYK